MIRIPAVLLLTSLAASAQLNLMPIPSSIKLGQGTLDAKQFSIRFIGPTDQRLRDAIVRHNLTTQSSGATLTIRISSLGNAIQTLGEDESYRLEIAPQTVNLTAATSLGALRGIQTLIQLRESGPLPVLIIEDKPRFPWRGLHMDVARHFMPVEVIKRNLDGMAAVKLNVFHWHLSDDQGFRVESKLYPKLQEKGSDGLFYTQPQIRDIVAYARDRGIRVVPEFDIPGHATSWLVGYPELSAGPGPFQLIRTWGIFDATLDPSNPKVYEFLDNFIGEMAGLFPDAYFHIGGDEVTGKQWKANSTGIPELSRKTGLKSQEAIHNYFNQKVQALVAKHGRRMEGWDEILNDGLPRNIVIQSWRGQKSLFEAARQGFSGILSAGYYLDHMDTAATMYQVDPLDEKGRATGMLRNPDAAKAPPGAPLTQVQRDRILGGEVCMWAEYVSPETIDSRIWPRTAAIAERFWSPAETNNIPDMYRRLDWISTYLDRFGLTHNANYTAMLERLSGSKDITALRTLADVVTPGDLGLRHRMKKDYTQQTLLNRFVDTARPDSLVVRNFAQLVEQYSVDKSNAKLQAQIESQLDLWIANDVAIAKLSLKQKDLAEVAPISRNLARLSQLAKSALHGTLTRPETFRDAKQPVSEVRLTVADAIEKLIRPTP